MPPRPAPLQDFVHAQAAACGSQACTLASSRARRLSCSGAGIGDARFGIALRRHAQFDLAAAHLRGQQLAQGRFEAAQFVGQAQCEIEETTVDRTQLDRDGRA